MKRTPTGGGLMLLLMVLLGFGHCLHLEILTQNRKPGDRAAQLVRHKREWIIPPVSIYEGQDNSHKNPIARIQSDSKLHGDRIIHYSITGQGVTEPPLGIFVINEFTGDLNVTGIVDREETPMFFLKGYARDQNNVNVEQPIDLRVRVLDINDNAPVFTQEIFDAAIEELSATNKLIMILNATDADEANTANSQLIYRILSQEPRSSHFSLTKNEIRTTTTALDRETQSSYILLVEVRDRGGDDRSQGLSTTASVRIKVTDVNDNIPILEREEYEGAIEENVANVEILRMTVFDGDEEFTDNWYANFTIVSGNEGNHFTIITDKETNEGVLMMVKEADYEMMQSADLKVVVSNRAEYHSSIRHLVSGGGAGGGGGGAGGGGGGGGKVIPIKVKVKNVREGPVFKPKIKTFSVSEGGKFIINQVIGSYQAYDSDTGKIAEHIKYAKEYDADNWFMIDSTTAEIRLVKVPDRESIYVVNGTYIAKILAISEDVSAQLIPKDLWEGPHRVQILITDNKGLSCPEKQVLKLRVCTCSNGDFACKEMRSDGAVGLGGGAIALMILACLLLLLLPLLLLICFCGSGGEKGFLAVDGPEQSMLIHNKEGPEPVDAAAMPSAIGTVGSAGVKAGAGVGGGVGTRDDYGYGYNDMYHSNIVMNGHYEDNRTFLSRREMTTGADGGGGNLKMISSGGSAAGAAAGAGYGYGSAGGTAENLAALNEEFIGDYFYNKVMGIADEDLAQASKDCLLIYSQEGTGSIAGSVGCCSIIESEFEEDYLDDLGLKFKTLADICQGADGGMQFSQNESYEEFNKVAEATADFSAIQNIETVEERYQDRSHMSSESQVQRVEPESVVRENMVTEGSYVSSRYVQEPVMRGNVLVTEKSYTTAPTIILEPVRQQNVLVTERIIRPASSINNLVDVAEGENVMVTERVIKSDKGFSGFVSEPRDSQYMLVTERLLAPSSTLNAPISIPDQSMGQNVVVTERHYTPITAINGSPVIPVEVSGGPQLVKETVSIVDGGLQGQTHFKQGGYLMEQLHPANNNNVEKSSSRVTKYSTVQYTRS
ncbi:hypothetical protein GDO78_012576 [Eleutherodactylus coqui]|uniref:Cadherin domain-containing protein n=1 Tax=Eleutherodactylus coqui TaxID=57060 RepID=A0A8J6F1P9_ELECQ|nr:hypothetical protein GDO78_012576 [Eleutherodactylus coqui]